MAIGVRLQRTCPLLLRPRQQRLCARRLRTIVRAADDSFDLSRYQEAFVSAVHHSEKYGHVVYLKIKETQAVLPVYIGESESAALVKQINREPTARPLTHDLMKSTLEALGFRVTKVRITALVGNTYHARVHFARSRKPGAATSDLPAEVDIDARPSDAVNLAVRFNAAIYINREVATKMGQLAHSHEAAPAGGASAEQHTDIVRSCKEEIMAYNDPTIMMKLQMQLAIAENNFDLAIRLRDQIDKVLASDRALSLVVAMETALEDGRYDEAARLRDEFKALRKAQQLSSREVSDI